MRRINIIVLLLATFGLAGCFQPVEVTARDSLAASQGFLLQAEKNHHEECLANPAKPFPCGTIQQAIAAHNLAVEALRTYCGFTDASPAGAPCQPHKNVRGQLQAALANLHSIIAYYKEASK